MQQTNCKPNHNPNPKHD